MRMLLVKLVVQLTVKGEISIVICPPFFSSVCLTSLSLGIRDGETSVASASKLSSPPLDTAFSSNPAPAHALAPAPAPAPETKEFDGLDEFDPRGSFSGITECQNQVLFFCQERVLCYMKKLIYILLMHSMT